MCTPLSPPHKHREMLPPTFAGVWCNAGTADLQLLHKKFAYAPQIEAASKLMGCCMWRPSRWPDALMLATSSQCAVRTVLASPDRRSRAQQQAEPAQLARRCLYRAGAGACGCACQRSCIRARGLRAPGRRCCRAPRRELVDQPSQRARQWHAASARPDVVFVSGGGPPDMDRISLVTESLAQDA